VIFFDVSSNPVPAIATTAVTTMRTAMRRDPECCPFINSQHVLRNGDIAAVEVLFVVGHGNATHNEVGTLSGGSATTFAQFLGVAGQNISMLVIFSRQALVLAGSTVQPCVAQTIDDASTRHGLRINRKRRCRDGKRPVVLFAAQQLQRDLVSNYVTPRATI
jgi:hypothetical protein